MIVATLVAKDVVRGIIEEDGMLLVSFLDHAAYYRVPDSGLLGRIPRPCFSRVIAALRAGEQGKETSTMPLAL
jgi:hypothetical protein